METIKIQTEVLYDEYNSLINSATLVEGDNSPKIKFQLENNRLEVAVFDALGEEEVLLTLKKKEVLQLVKLIGDISKPLKIEDEPVIPEPPTEEEE